MRLTPEVMLVGDGLMARCRWTLDRETDRLAALVEDEPELAALFERNGWTPRMLAWAHILHGLMDLVGFDDEAGRT